MVTIIEEFRLYRPFDPGLYLYKMICNTPIDKKFEKEYIQLVYTTLIAWGMNSRGAKLRQYEDFENSIIKNQGTIKKLAIHKIESSRIENIEEELKILFRELNLVKREKPRLVTFSKTMHFYLPELIVPIDRTYTLPFFHVSWKSDNTKQFELLCIIENIFMDFAEKNIVELKTYKDSRWNQNIPKIIDSIIIGYGIFAKESKGRQIKKNA